MVAVEKYWVLTILLLLISICFSLHFVTWFLIDASAKFHLLLLKMISATLGLLVMQEFRGVRYNINLPTSLIMHPPWVLIQHHWPLKVFSQRIVIEIKLQAVVLFLVLSLGCSNLTSWFLFLILWVVNICLIFLIVWKDVWHFYYGTVLSFLMFLRLLLWDPSRLILLLRTLFIYGWLTSLSHVLFYILVQVYKVLLDL